MLLDQISLLSAGGGILLGAFLVARLLSHSLNHPLNHPLNRPLNHPLNHPRPLGTPDRLLGLLIVACALNAGHPALVKLFGVHVRAAGQFFEPLQFLLPPLLAAYTEAAVRGTFRPRPRHLLHGIPFLAAVTTSLACTVHGHAPTTVSVAMWAILTAQMLAYLGPALHMFRRYQASLVDRVSNLAPVDLGWLRRFFWLAAGLCLVSLTVLVLLLHDLGPATLGTGTSIALTAAVWFLGAHGLEQKLPDPEEPDGLAASERARPPGSPGPAQATSTGRSDDASRAQGVSSAPGPAEAASADHGATSAGASEDKSSPERVVLAPADAHRLRNTLDEVFATQRPHLDPDLGLSHLAQLVGAPRNQVSFVINNELGVNFYDLVNGWRVKEFQALAADPRRDGDKILTLAFEAGFNSKPTFNKVVLKLTGKTPSQLRRDVRNGGIGSRPSR